MFELKLALLKVVLSLVARNTASAFQVETSPLHCAALGSITTPTSNRDTSYKIKNNVWNAFDHPQGRSRAMITRRSVSMASSIADDNNLYSSSNKNNQQNMTALLSSMMVEDDKEKAIQNEINQKRQLVEQRQQLSNARTKFRVKLPLVKAGDPLGVAVCQVEKGRVLLNKLLDLDTLNIESSDQQSLRSMVQIDEVDRNFKGLVVSFVAEGGVAWNRGIRTGDLLLSVSATLGDSLWPKSTLEGVQSAISSRKLSSAGSMLLDLARLTPSPTTTNSGGSVSEEKSENQFELTLTRPIGLILQETQDGYVEVAGFTESAPNLIRHAVRVGDRVVAVDSSLGNKLWPVSTVDGVISACTSRLPGQTIKMRFERPDVNTMLGGAEIASDSTTSSSSQTVVLSSPSTSVTTASAEPKQVDVKQLLSRCRDVLRRYASEESNSDFDSQSRLFKGKYAVPSIVADKVVDALATASATIDTVTLSMIMKAYLSCQQPEKALLVFEASTGFSADGSVNPPLGIIKGVGGKALVPNESSLNLYTATALLQAHAMRKDFASVQRVLSALEGKSGVSVNGIESAPWPWTGVYGSLQPDTKLFNIAIAAADKIGGTEALDMALGIFNRLADPNDSAGNVQQPAKDIVSYNSVISALSNAGFSEDAISVFEQMKRAGVRPDKYTYTALIKACEHDGDIDELLYDMRERGVQADVVTYNTMIKTLCGDCQWTQATRLVTEMETRGISPNSLTYGYIMNAMLKAGKPGPCLALFESACGSSRTSTFTENVYIYTSAITAASMLGNHERALELVMRMNSNGIKPNLKTLTAVMGACLAAKKYDLASQVFRKIEEPDGYAVAQGIRAFSSNGDLPEAVDLLRLYAAGRSESRMSGKDATASYTTVFTAAVDQEDFESARMTVADMVQKGFIPGKKLLGHVFETVRSVVTAMSTSSAEVPTSWENRMRSEELFDLCLFLIDTLRNRALPVEGSLYAATLFLGNRLGGASKAISFLLVQTKQVVDMTAKEMVVNAPAETDGSSVKTREFRGWEDAKRSHIVNELSYTKNDAERFHLPKTPVRISTKEVRTVLKAEQAVSSFVPKKKKGRQNQAAMKHC